MSQNYNSNESRVARNEHNHNPHPKLRIVKRVILSLIGLLVLMIAFGAGLFFYYASSAPKITEQALSSDNSTKIYDANGQVISRLGVQNRDYATNSQIPDRLKEAVISIEDRRFYKEHGIDPLRIMSAAFGNLTGSSLGLQGGSTLTQQLVKLSVFSTAASDRTMKRKAQEAWLAIKVDQQYSKAKILEFYINKVYMGNNVYGMKTAAEYYYGKSLKKLSLPQYALIAGIPQSPTLYNPYQYPKYAKERRDQVLEAMVENHKLSKTEADQAKKVSIKSGLVKNHHNTDPTSVNEQYIDAYLKQTLQELKAKGYSTRAGIKVYTNLDLSTQKQLYKAANNNPIFPNNQFQVGATMVNAKNGKVTAMLGSRKTKISFGLNRAVQTDRSSGSTMKPLMDYGPAIEDLYFPTYQTVQDTPYTYPGTNTKLMDFDNRYEGSMTMRRALIESRNIPAIRTLQTVGIDRATEFLKGLGMTFKTPLNFQNGIGAYISTEQEAAAYAAFANGGIYHKPYFINKIVEANGTVKKYHSTGHRAMSEATAFMITDMLKGVLTDANGSGTAAQIPGLNEAGKTGTTQYPSNFLSQVPDMSSMDSWFTGYTPNYVLSLWSGYDRPFQTGHYITEQQSTIVQQMYRSVMAYAMRNKNNPNWTQPSSVGSTQKNGKTEYYVMGHNNEYGQPTNANDASVTTNSRQSSSSSSDKDSDNSTNNSSGRNSSDTEQPDKNSSSKDSSNTDSSDASDNSSSSSSDSSSSSSSSSSDQDQNTIILPNNQQNNNQNNNNQNNNQNNGNGNENNNQDTPPVVDDK